MNDLAKNLAELEKVIGGKSENVKIVEDGGCFSIISSSPSSSILQTPENQRKIKALVFMLEKHPSQRNNH